MEPLNCLFYPINLCRTFSPPPVLFTKVNYEMREKKIFFGCFSVSRYIKGEKFASLDAMAFLDTHVSLNNPYWESSGIIIFFV